MRLHHRLPVSGHDLVDVVGTGRFTLVFDDPARSRIWLEGPFVLVSGEQSDEYRPPCAEWVRGVLLSLVGVRVTAAKYSRTGDLALQFADARRLLVPDGPFENWHYSNAEGERLCGGVGRIS